MKLDYKNFPFEETKQIPFEIKEFDEETGIFEGYAAVFNNVDDGGDLIEPGAFTKTLQENGHRIKICYQHDPYNPIGKPLEIRQDEVGLFVKGKISDTSTGKDVKVLLKDRVINELSIGYDVIKKKMKDGVRRLREIKLYEFSPVTWGMNKLAIITDVKSLLDRLSKKDLMDKLEGQELREERWRITSALDDVIYDLLDNEELSDEDKVSEFKTSLEQYSEIMITWFTQMLGLEKSEIRKLEIKAGRVLSAKNKQIVEKAVKSSENVIDALTALLEATEPDDDKSTQKQKEAAEEDKEEITEPGDNNPTQKDIDEEPEDDHSEDDNKLSDVLAELKELTNKLENKESE